MIYPRHVPLKVSLVLYRITRFYVADKGKHKGKKNW